jgi:hypothetical protein
MKDFNDPIRGKGIGDALRHRGFEILLLDEFRTPESLPKLLATISQNSKESPIRGHGEDTNIPW